MISGVMLHLKPLTGLNSPGASERDISTCFQCHLCLASCFCNYFCYYPHHSCGNRLKCTSRHSLIVFAPPLRSCPTPRSAASNASPRRCCLNKCCSPFLEPRPPRCSPAAPPCLTLCASSGSSAQSLLPSRRATL